MSRPLQGKRIVVTRPAAQAASLADRIVAQGGEARVFPLLEISPESDPEALQGVLEALESYAIAFFISPNAVEYALPAILSRRAWPDGLKVGAVGPGTVRQLTGYGFVSVIAPERRFDSEGVLEMPEFQENQVKGRRIVILRGNGGRELLAETLVARGAKVDCVACYRRSAPGTGEPLMSWLRNNEVDALALSSSEGLRNLRSLLDTETYERLRLLPVFVPHARIAAAARELGLQKIILTGPADAGLVDGLCAFSWQDSC